MTNWTLEEAIEFFNESKKAYLAALKMQEYTIKDRSVKRAHLDSLTAEMNKWKAIMASLQGKNTGITIKRAVPVDL